MSQIGLLEFKVLTFILDRKRYLKYKEIVKPEFFRSRELRLIYKAITQMHLKVKQPVVKVKDIWLLLEKKVDPEDILRYKKILIRMRAQAVAFSRDDEEVINLSITKFAQENQLRQVLNARAQELQAGQDVDLTDLKMQVDKIVSLEGVKKIKDYEYDLMHEERLNKRKEPFRHPTGMSMELDHALSGGLAAGELAFFLAPPGRGKTLALVNIGANALKRGQKVFHITLEISARAVGKRYDCCLAETEYANLREDPTLLSDTIRKLRESGAKLLIRDYSYTHCGISELHSIIQEHWDNNNKFDMLIVDYADLMVPPEKYKDSRHEASRIYEELRIIAGHFKIPVWTASQGNRISLSKKTISMAEIAESFAKANVADLIIGMCQTDDEVLEKEMRLAVCKNRLGPTKPIVPVMCDPSRMLLRSMRGDDMQDVWLKPNLGKIRKRAVGGKKDDKKVDSKKATSR